MGNLCANPGRAGHVGPAPAEVEGVGAYSPITTRETPPSQINSLAEQTQTEEPENSQESAMSAAFVVGHTGGSFPIPIITKLEWWVTGPQENSSGSPSPGTSYQTPQPVTSSVQAENSNIVLKVGARCAEDTVQRVEDAFKLIDINNFIKNNFEFSPTDEARLLAHIDQKNYSKQSQTGFLKTMKKHARFYSLAEKSMAPGSNIVSVLVKYGRMADFNNVSKWVFNIKWTRALEAQRAMPK